MRRQWPSPLASAATRPTGITRAPFGLACQRPWTALRLLARTPAIAGEARLPRNADRPTEVATIRYGAPHGLNVPAQISLSQQIVPLAFLVNVTAQTQSSQLFFIRLTTVGTIGPEIT